MDPTLFFLILLFVVMAGALISGYPVAFALPGSAILVIILAGVAGYWFAGDASTYFKGGSGPISWLSSGGVSNFRATYWSVERDTLIAIPLFIFMGIMLQRSKIAEDLLVTMAKLFGPVPGGLGISVVIVGALLAATTGIVGATVVAMGLISLPAMMRNGYSMPLATGTICASGTLGQIIPPSIVLIILADQLGSAADAAQTLRQDAYNSVHGAGGTLPADLAVSSASAGDMFLGALVPGALIMVPLYVLYILITALLRPSMAPPVRFGDETKGAAFLRSVFMALVPPLLLIVLVLGSIIAGYATVNQAGAIGASGAILMAGYRLMDTQRLRTFAPVILAIAALLGLGVLTSAFPMNLKAPNKTSADVMALLFGTGLALILMGSIAWSTWRIYKREDILREVMVESAKTTSMVFLILMGAAMLTAAFTAFGGKDLVQAFLEGLPGGFFTKFLVVMLVMFILGFFLDFIEIAVVVVPITAPILLADPTANISAVWLGVMIGINIQTSFLTPPFGFALFYLRGVAPPEVKTTQIYRGVMVFIALQLTALAIVGMNERTVNFLPRLAALSRETAPSLGQPAIQACVEPLYFEAARAQYANTQQTLAALTALDLSTLPEAEARNVLALTSAVPDTYARIDELEAALMVHGAAMNVDVMVSGAIQPYSSLHQQVRRIERDMADLAREADGISDELLYLRGQGAADDATRINAYEARMSAIDGETQALAALIPAEWAEAFATASEADKVLGRARLNLKRTDNKFNAIPDVLTAIDRGPAFAALAARYEALGAQISAVSSPEDAERAQGEIDALAEAFGAIGGASKITTPLKKASRPLRGDAPDVAGAEAAFAEAWMVYETELAWRTASQGALHATLSDIQAQLGSGIALRAQDRIPRELRRPLAWCLAGHQDISLRF